MHTPATLWDAFISHASEDKERFVRPLAQALTALGARIWYDEFSLRLGDSLSRSVDKGLAQSRFGIVILSKAFMMKPWPEYELRGLVAKEINGHSTILPIWHEVEHEAVLNFSPPLADKFAVRTAGASAEQIALQILSVIRPDIYASHPHAELKRLVSGEAVQQLQAELEDTRAALAAFQCPLCGSALVESQEVPLDMEQRDFGSLRSFECGYTELAGGMHRPCPNDPQFPKFDEYEVRCQEHPSETLSMFRWSCNAFPKSIMAHGVPLKSTYGATEEIARDALRQNYEAVARPREKRHAS
jgi:TIR domain-containing protein